MKEGTTLEERYVKEVGIARFIVDWILISANMTLLIFGVLTLVEIFQGMVLEKDFDIIRFLLNESFLANPELPLIIMFIFLFSEGYIQYSFIRKTPFASFTDEKVVLDFERKSFLWGQIQAVRLEGSKILVVFYEEEGKNKKKSLDLRWFPKKEDFILRLKNECSVRNIPFHESGLTFCSKILMWMGLRL